MKLLPKLLAATSIFAATAAIAGPPVTVTFKNQGTANATFFPDPDAPRRAHVVPRQRVREIFFNMGITRSPIR